MTDRIEALERRLAAQDERIAQLSAAVAHQEDRESIERLQYAYGYFMDNRMFDEMIDLFCDDAPWMEIGQRGRYFGKARIHAFLLDVLGDGRWGLLRDEVINHVQMQPLITVEPGAMTACSRARAQVQGNSPPTTEFFLLAEAIYENEYVRENGVWKIKGLGVAMTYYTLLPREKIWFHSAPPSEAFPPDQPSLPDDPGLGRQFAPWHFTHPVKGYALRVPASAPVEAGR
jgi:uncharacterized coiled-coil protein SlyX